MKMILFIISFLSSLAMFSLSATGHDIPTEHMHAGNVVVLGGRAIDIVLRISLILLLFAFACFVLFQKMDDKDKES